MASGARAWWEPKALTIPLLVVSYSAGVVFLMVVFDLGIAAAAAIQVAAALLLGASWTLHDWRAHRGPWRGGT